MTGAKAMERQEDGYILWREFAVVVRLLSERK
jgi:hypothetical protein